MRHLYRVSQLTAVPLCRTVCRTLCCCVVPLCRYVATRCRTVGCTAPPPVPHRLCRTVGCAAPPLLHSTPLCRALCRCVAPLSRTFSGASTWRSGLPHCGAALPHSLIRAHTRLVQRSVLHQGFVWELHQPGVRGWCRTKGVVWGLHQPGVRGWCDTRGWCEKVGVTPRGGVRLAPGWCEGVMSHHSRLHQPGAIIDGVV